MNIGTINKCFFVSSREKCENGKILLMKANSRSPQFTINLFFLGSNNSFVVFFLFKKVFVVFIIFTFNFPKIGIYIILGVAGDRNTIFII